VGAATIGLTLEEGKRLLAALQLHLVQAQAEDHSRPPAMLSGEYAGSLTARLGSHRGVENCVSL
jgi:hypothetical protein